MSEYIRISVAYAGVHEQALVPLEAHTGISVREAIDQSGVLTRFPEIDLEVYRVGIYGRLTTLDQKLDEGDRVEIYRPLIADPKEARRRRAEEGKQMRKGVRDAG